MSLLLILIGLILLILLWGVTIYNKLVRLKNQVKNSWKQIDVQLQRRYDLIPNLVEAVKGYMAHERGTLEAVTEARNQASRTRETIQASGAPTESSMKELLAAESTLKGGMANIFALAENYPQLRASENMRQLQEELASTENKVAFSRQAYNDQVMLYNTTQEQFPAVLVAGTFGHTPASLFEVEGEEVKKGIKVKF
jgi:LemA protein